VVVKDLSSIAPGWYARALVLQLEREGVDVRMPAVDAELATPTLVADDGPVAIDLVVADGWIVGELLDDDRFQMLARWRNGLTDDEVARQADAVDELVAAHADGELTDEEFLRRLHALQGNLPRSDAISGDVAVFVDRGAEHPGTG
jgi:hypothetical protein